jgi:uncharacterized protein YggE
MKMLLAVAVALALLPLAASAQAPMLPPRSGVTGVSGGITVQGHGSVRYPVKTVQFSAQVRGAADESGVLAAMRAAGIDDPVVGPAGSQIFSSTQSMLRGTVHDVSRAKLERIGQAAAQYMSSHPGATLDVINFFAAAEDCAAHEQAARSAALDDARHKADAIAVLAGVSIDGVAAVGESGGCPYGIDPSMGGFGSAQLDLARLTATVTVVETVTFSITTATGPTRRRPT